jgi:RNA polymerase sigma factor (sigma-70 family)
VRELFERFQRGDGDAFAEVMRAHMGIVRKAAAAFFREPFAQEEAMQEIWLHVYAKRASLDLDRHAEFPGWLSTLARRRCLDLLRQPSAPIPVDDIDAVVSSHASDVQPDVTVDRELRAAVDALKAKLDPMWARFFELCFVQGLPYEDIAAQLHIGKLRCKYMKKVLISRARRHRPLMEALGRRTSTAATIGGSDVH